MKNRLVAWLIPVIVGVAIWFIPVPEGVKPAAWHLLAIFVATIIAFITAPMPMGAVSITALVIAILTNTLKVGDALSGFSNSTIWLIVAAFLLSRGFIKTGLGKRIAYMLIRAFGKNPITLAYALLISDLIVAPATPSNAARAGGVIYPITRSLASAFNSEPDDGTARRIGAFLIQAIYQANTVTSAMFMTSMAGNTLIVSLVAKTFDIQMSWGLWALAAIVPGLISLFLIPLVLFKLYPPELKETPEAQRIAKEELEAMGPVSRPELVMLFVFFGALILWGTATITAIDATTVALLGVSVLLATDVLTWNDVKEEKGAWDTLVWMGTLITMASFLTKLGFIPWFANLVGASMSGASWLTAFILLMLVYTYMHYAFASLTAHIAAMYIPFVSVAIGLGTPTYLALLGFAFASNLCMSLTHYAAAPSPICFGSGYITQSDWWRLGFIFSVLNMIIWIGVGSAWWKVLGLW